MFLYLPSLRDSVYRKPTLSLLCVCDSHFYPPLSSSRLKENENATQIDKLNKYLEEKDLFHHYLLSFYENEVIALVNFVITEDSIEVDTICVHPNHRNTGVAKQFYDYLLHTICPKHGLSSISVECNKKAVAHIQLLNQLGFIVTHNTDTHYLFVKKSA